MKVDMPLNKETKPKPYHSDSTLDAFAKVVKVMNPESHWTVRCQAHLICPDCCSLDLSL